MTTHQAVTTPHFAGQALGWHCSCGGFGWDLQWGPREAEQARRGHEEHLNAVERAIHHYDDMWRYTTMGLPEYLEAT